VRARAATAPVGPLPLLGVADPAMTLMGASPGGEPGEAWGYRELPLSVGEVTAGGNRLDTSPPSGAGQGDPQLAFVRHTDATGWQVFDLPLDESGQAYRGPVPNPLSARITHTGGGVLVGRDLNRPSGQQVVVIAHDPGGNWRALSPPPPDVLLPAEGEAPAESLADDQGLGAIANAAFAEGGGPGCSSHQLARSVADAVIHFDGGGWKREPVEVPPGSESLLHILAIDATGLGNAWALAEAAPYLGRSVVLLERTSTPEGPLWVERPLAGTPFADAEAPAEGIAGVAPVGGASQPLTVTTDGVWIDLTATIEGISRDVTVFYDSGDGAVTGSWCDASSLRWRAWGQALPPGRLPQLRLAGRRVRHPHRHQLARPRRTPRAATAAPTCASPTAYSRGCPGAAATSAAAGPSPMPTAAGSRGRWRSRRRCRLRDWSRGRSRFGRL
jgi:hypothetical protein